MKGNDFKASFSDRPEAYHRLQETMRLSSQNLPQPPLLAVTPQNAKKALRRLRTRLLSQMRAAEPDGVQDSVDVALEGTEMQWWAPAEPDGVQERMEARPCALVEQEALDLALTGRSWFDRVRAVLTKQQTIGILVCLAP